jgi:hypothetical protein
MYLSRFRFREHRCGGDGEEGGITFYYCMMGYITVGIEPVAVNEQQEGSGLQSVNSSVHGSDGGAEDIHLVYLGVGAGGYAPCCCRRGDLIAQAVALPFGKFLGVVQFPVAVSLWQYDCCSVDRSRQAASSCLIASGFLIPSL